MDRAQIIVVRHGETTWNLEGRRQGHLDSPLTARGIAQAESLARRLKKFTFKALYSSDLGRACRTAEIIANTTGHKVTVDERLRERNLGIFQGLHTEEIRQAHPEAYRLHTTLGPDYVIPSGESMRQQVERNIRCLEEIAQKHLGETIVVVTHVGVLSGLFRHTLSIPFQAPRRFEFRNASINIFTYQNQGFWVLQTWGDTGHLDAPELGDGL
ncbi:MAG: histidine phosphatase family protein [Deltaproteobacteria bacterium]|nr:histidine phosphatase family protein [Deltaproteobacteria bacterium]